MKIIKRKVNVMQNCVDFYDSYELFSIILQKVHRKVRGIQNLQQQCIFFWKCFRDTACERNVNKESVKFFYPSLYTYTQKYPRGEPINLVVLGDVYVFLEVYSCVEAMVRITRGE